MRLDIILLEACSIFLPLWHIFVHKSWGWGSFSALKIYSTYKQNYMSNPSIHHLSFFFFLNFVNCKFHSPSFYSSFAFYWFTISGSKFFGICFQHQIAIQSPLFKTDLLTRCSSQMPRILPCFLTSYKHICTPKVSPYAFPQLSILDFSHNSQKL